MARSITAPSPIRALCRITDWVILAPLATRTFGDSTQSSIRPPEMMQPGLTIESVAVPSRVNLAPGICAMLLQIGQSLLYRLKTGSTETRSMCASW